jgi:tetratricopeptide (TPR) repeat protein
MTLCLAALLLGASALVAAAPGEADRTERWMQRGATGELLTVLREIEALDDDPAALRPEERLAHAFLLETAGRYESAIDVLVLLLEADPANPELRRRRANLDWYRGEYDAALTALGALAADLPPDDPLRPTLESDLGFLRGDRRERDVLRASKARLDLGFTLGIAALLTGALVVLQRSRRR